MGESSFWYRPTRVVPDQRPLNGRCCCCCHEDEMYNIKKSFFLPTDFHEMAVNMRFKCFRNHYKNNAVQIA